jgi:hypothetical protein
MTWLLLTKWQMDTDVKVNLYFIFTFTSTIPDVKALIRALNKICSSLWLLFGLEDTLDHCFRPDSNSPPRVDLPFHVGWRL